MSNPNVRSGEYLLLKRTKTQVKKTIQETGKFYGFMCGNKVNPKHLAEGWGLGTRVTFLNADGFEDFIKKFETHLSVYTPELGSYPHYYQIIKEGMN